MDELDDYLVKRGIKTHRCRLDKLPYVFGDCPAGLVQHVVDGKMPVIELRYAVISIHWST